VPIPAPLVISWRSELANVCYSVRS